MSRLFDDASSQYLSGPGGIITATPLTMFCWLWCDDPTLGSDCLLMDLHVSTSAAFRNCFVLTLAPGSGGVVRAVTGSNTNSSNASTTVGIAYHRWQNACAVFASATDRRIFLNGGNKITNATSRVPTGTINLTTVGRESASTPARYMSGRIAHAAWWNEALTDAEAEALGRGLNPLRVRPHALVCYLPLMRDDRDARRSNHFTPNGGPRLVEDAPVQSRIWYAAFGKTVAATRYPHRQILAGVG